MARKFTLKHLRYFVAAAEHQSTKQAALSLNVSQPSISGAIAHLEALYKIGLFVRHHAQGITLTNAGKDLLNHAYEVLRTAQQFDRAGEEFDTTLKGTIYAGCLVTFAPILMPALGAAFRRKFTDSKIHFVETDQADQIKRLRNGELDLCITYDFGLDDHMAFEEIVRLPPYVLLAADHPLAQAKSVALEDLVDEPMILLDLPISREYMSRMFDTIGKVAKIEHLAANPAMVHSLVANGFGYSFYNIKLPDPRAADGTPLVCCPLTGNAPSVCLGVVTLKNARHTKIINKFINFCKQHIAAIV